MPFILFCWIWYILGAESGTPPSAGGALPRPDALFTPPGDRNRLNQTFSSFVSKKLFSYISFLFKLNKYCPVVSSRISTFAGILWNPNRNHRQIEIKTKGPSAIFVLCDYASRSYNSRFYTRTWKLCLINECNSTVIQLCQLVIDI